MSAVLARYNFDADTTNSAGAANITVSSFTGGPGLTEVAHVTTDGQPPGSWYGENWSTSNDATAVRDSDLYAWFRVTVDSGMTMSLTNLSFDVKPHGSGPRSVLVDVIQVGGPIAGNLLGNVFYHTDQSQTGELDPASTSGGASTRKVWETANFGSSSFTNLTGTYEIRIFGYNAPQSDREALIDNIILQGTVTAIPEPSAFLLCGLGSLALMARRAR